MTTEYKDVAFTNIYNKSATSKRYEIKAVLIAWEEMSFAGIKRTVDTVINGVIEAEDMESAIEICVSEIEALTPDHKQSVKHGVDYYYNIKAQQ